MESTRSHLAYNVEILSVAFVAIVVSAVVAACGGSSTPSKSAGKAPATSATSAATTPQPGSASHLTVTSSAFSEGATIPVRFTCSGTSVSPPLAWSDPPSGSNGFAVVVDDPDAPGGTFVHWVMVGLDAGRRALAEGERPAGVTEGNNSSGRSGYTGPCPPPGKPHHYRFTVYAVRQRPASPTPAAVAAAAVASGTLTGMFGR